VRIAAGRTADPQQRLCIRAAHLAARPEGLLPELTRWLARLPWLLALAAVLIGLLSWEALHAVAGQDRRINAVGALLTLLTLPTLSLLLWCGSLLRAGTSGGLARWTLDLAARSPGLRTPHALRLLGAGLDTLGRARLLPWGLGLLNHLIWIAAFACILLGLMATFSFRAYTLSWETTILGPEFFARLVQILGWLPAQLGFPVPTSQAVAQGSLAAADQRSWAWWLMGCTVVYGLLPRLIAALLCGLVWRRRRASLGLLDTDDTYTQELLARFARWDTEVIRSGLPLLAAAPGVGSLALIGFELPHDMPLPFAALGDAVSWRTRIDGTAQERRDTLDHIAQVRPSRLLLACNASATPDRGTARFLAAAAPEGAAVALLLLGNAADGRWLRWMAEGSLKHWPLFDDRGAAQAWLLEGRDV